MTQDQIMELVDDYAMAQYDLAFVDEHGDGKRNEARAAVVAAIDALTKDAERMNFIESHAATNALEWNRKSKWTYHRTFTSYEYQTFKSAREAIDAAIAAMKEQV